MRCTCPSCGSEFEIAQRFRPPTASEVKDYCATREVKIDPQAFVDHYDANGWKVGRVPMKDWRAAVRTWERSEKVKRSSNGGPAKFSDAWIDQEFKAGRLQIYKGESYHQVRQRLMR